MHVHTVLGPPSEILGQLVMHILHTTAVKLAINRYFGQPYHMMARTELVGHLVVPETYVLGHHQHHISSLI